MKKQYDYRTIIAGIAVALRASGVDCHLKFVVYHENEESDRAAILFVGDPANYQTPQFNVTGNEGRVVFSPTYHLQFVRDDHLRHSEHTLPRNFAMDSITISADKDPAVIAKQFKARMLDEWLPKHAEAMNWLNEDIADAERRVENMKKLGIPASRCYSDMHYVDSIRCRDFRHDKVYIEGVSVTYEQLAAIRKVLKP